MSDPEILFKDLFNEEVYVVSGGTIVVTNRAWAAIDKSEVELLSKILSAVDLNLSSVQFICSERIGINELKIRNPKNVLLFGTDLIAGLIPYQLSSVEGINMILVDELATLDDTKKKSLWIALKEMFKK